MRRFARLLSAIMVISILLCLSSCGKSGKSESEYKSAISKHMREEHDLSINSYESFNIKDNGGADALIRVTAQLALGDGTIELKTRIELDKDCNVTSCSWCN